MGRRSMRRQRGYGATKAAMASLVAAALEKTQISKYFTNTKGGHGFAAEDANNLADRWRGKDAKVVGQTNERHGADRRVAGVQIQSKYYQDATSTMRSVFDPDGGGYRYPGQVLEVPKDQHDQCVELMRKRISEGQVPPHTDPADAEKLVRKGTVTYKQARNIARAGNIDSVKFDIKTGAVVAIGAFGMSVLINYWYRRRQGMNKTDALDAALKEALSTGLTTLGMHVLSAQLLRTKVAALGTVAVRRGVSAVARTSMGKKAVEGIAKASLNKAVHGTAAVKHVSKLLRTNAVTGAVTATIMCAPDFYRAAFDNSISWRQFTKNSVVNVASVAGGVGGWMGGAASGAALGSVIPGVGTAAGGLIGGIAGGVVGSFSASKVTKSIADKVAPDDAEALIRMLEEELQELSFEYMLSECEVVEIMDVVRETVASNPEWLRSMYRETQGHEEVGRCFVRDKFEGEFQKIAERRQKIVLPLLLIGKRHWLAEQIKRCVEGLVKYLRQVGGLLRSRMI